MNLPDTVDDYVHRRMEQSHISGLALAVAHRGRSTAQAYGEANLEWNAPTSTDAAFQLASVTKLFTATLLMRLVEDDLVRLEASVRDYLPDAPAAWQAITISRLASHTSGIADDVGQPASVRDAVRSAYGQPLAYEPGTQVQYGLVDYAVLAHIMETVTGTPFPTLLHERLAEPLGLGSTGFDNAAEDGPARTADVLRHRATVYNWEADRQRIYSFLFPAWTYAAGGLYSSASDLAAWAAALQGREILRADTLERMWTPERLSDGSPGTFGIGWIVAEHRGRRVTGHSGGPALADLVHVVDSDLTVAVLTNQQNLRPDLALSVADLLLDATD